MDIGGAQVVNVEKLATAISEGKPISKFLPTDVRKAVKKVASDGLDPKEYKEFKRIVDSSKSVRAGRFAKNVDGFLGNRGERGKVAAFVILGLVKSGRKDVATRLLGSLVKSVFPEYEHYYSKAPNASE